jgi:type VI secretion system protein ImpE
MPSPIPRDSAAAVGLDQAIAALMSAVRKHPGDMRLRVHLAQLCMQLGQWERALTQLQTIALSDPAHLPFAQAYREAIRCERVRERVFAGELSPPVLGEPSNWIAQLAQALQLRAKGAHAAADALQAEALESAPATPFKLDGVQLEWLSDADSRLGPVCELLINGQYFWTPFEDIQRLEIEAPSDLRDLVWIPARLTLSNGGQHPVLIPTRYPGSATCDDDALRGACATRWIELSPDCYAGLGQRMWASDTGEHPLLDARHLERAQTAPSTAASTLNG